ncbi:Uncharacterised protein [Serratia odorifera]|jgi:hypothetical protein|uniref:Uncharacterized protein n=2 Tax=Serratia odorifera TaxID=618 RepID=D4E4P8_SEROD|nr:hypothetical protein HMPREF0758_3148 [Serratia odorifera DSM 4582]VDZ61532.1 Uncharacterised protein [Serratia odorifera]
MNMMSYDEIRSSFAYSNYAYYRNLLNLQKYGGNFCLGCGICKWF